MTIAPRILGILLSGAAVAAMCSCTATATVTGTGAPSGLDGGADDASGGTDATMGGEASSGDDGSSGGGSEASLRDGPSQVDADPCGANLATDSNNCGACGHSCMGANCAGGFCQGTEVLNCSDGTPTIAGIDKTAGYIWANCETMVTRASTTQIAPLSELEYYAATSISGAASNISFAQVVGSSIFWVEIHTNFDGGVAKQSTFVETPTASNSAVQLFTIDGQVTDAAFDANYTYYDNPADSGNLWRFNHDGTGGVKIGPPASWDIAQDATNLYYSTADTISVTHGVRVAKAGGGVTTVVTDTGLPVNTANRWFFGIDATNFYYGELTSGQFGSCSMPGFGVYGGSLTGSGASQVLVPNAFTLGLVADNGEVAWLGPDCATSETVLKTYRPGGAILPIAGWTAFAPTTMIFDDTWLYYDSTNNLLRIPR